MSLHVIERNVIVYPPTTERLVGDERQTYASCRVVSEHGSQLASEYYLPEGEVPRPVLLTTRNGQTHILTVRSEDYLVTQYSRLPKREAQRKLFETERYSFVPGFGDKPTAYIATKDGQSIVDGEIIGTFVDWGKKRYDQAERELFILETIIRSISDADGSAYLQKSLDWMSERNSLAELISARRRVLDYMRDQGLQVSLSQLAEHQGAAEIKGMHLAFRDLQLANQNLEVTVPFLEDSYLFTFAATVLTTLAGGNSVRPFSNPQYIAVISSQEFSPPQIESYGSFPESTDAYMNLAHTAVNGLNNGLGLYAIQNRKSGIDVVRYTGFTPIRYGVEKGQLITPVLDDGTYRVLPLLNDVLEYVTEMNYKSAFMLVGNNIFERK